MPAPLQFRREYLLRLPLPLAQLYSRAYNAKDARARHDNCFYLFEALIKLAACPLIAAYVRQVREGGPRVERLDSFLTQLALPSLGQWVGFLQELARHFGDLPDAASHPLGHVFEQLDRKHKQPSAIVTLYRRIKNGPDNPPAGDASCSLRQLFDAIVQYRNLVFGHGASRFESFYEQEMGPLLFPAVNELLEDGTFDMLGPKGTRLAYLTELRSVGEGRFELGLRELVGTQGERMAPITVSTEQAGQLAPSVVALIWPGAVVGQVSNLPATSHRLETCATKLLRLDPLLAFRESEVADELLFMNRDRNGKQVEYLSYTTGRTERLKETAEAMAEMLSVLAGRPISDKSLPALAEAVRKGEREGVAPETPSPRPLPSREREKDQAPRRQLGDYELLAEIGRGGMGVVYLARQLSLGRLVALKTLPAELTGDDVSLTRFQREMRALSQCDHPNIVKLLDSGRLPDGNLYYTMEYVNGCDLEQVWRELSKSDAAAEASTLNNLTLVTAIRTASDRKLEMVRSRSEKMRAASPLPIGRGGGGEGEQAEQTAPSPLPSPLRESEKLAGGYVRRVCELIRDVAMALHSVHDQHVVHRDVSPANMMLTADGSRIVLMDFGLAKAESVASGVSVQGGFAGKLRYSAPEQLASAMLRVGPAADIRGLGVTLWELLTRRRLFADAQDERQLASMILQMDPPRLREVDPSFDRDLEAIVARATERNSQDRIQSAERLAEYLQLYLDGKPLPIRPPTTGEMVARWVRSHKPLVYSASGMLAMIVGIVIIAFILITSARDRAVRLAEEKTVLAASERAAKERALAAEQSAEAQRSLAMETLHKLVFEIQDKLENRVGMHKLRESLLNIALADIQKLYDVQLGGHIPVDRNEGQALLRTVVLYQSTGRAEQMLKPALSAKAVFRRILDEHPNDLTAQNDLIRSYGILTMVYLATGKSAKAMDTAQEALRLAEQFNSRDPSSIEPLATALRALGDVQNRTGRPGPAVETFHRGLNLAQRIVATQPDAPRPKKRILELYGLLGQAYADSGQTQLARDYMLKELDLAERLAKDSDSYLDQRDVAIALSRLSDLYVQMGQTQQALDNTDRALKTFKSISRAQPNDTESSDDYAQALIRQGDLQLRMGRPDDAVAPYEQALEIYRQIDKLEPDSAHFQRRLASALGGLGWVLLHVNRPNQAMERYKESLKIRQALADADKDNPEIVRELALANMNIADAYGQLGLVDEAESHFQKAFEIHRKLADQPNAAVRASQDLAIVEQRLGSVNIVRGRLDQAARHFSRSLQIAEKILADDPANNSAHFDVAVAHYRLGDLYARRAAATQPDSADRLNRQAIEHFGQAVTHYSALARDAGNAQARQDLVVTNNRMGDVKMAMGQPEQALDYYSHALDLIRELAPDKDNVQARSLLVGSLLKLGFAQSGLKRYEPALANLKQALAVASELVAARPQTAEAYRLLSNAHVAIALTHGEAGDPAKAAEGYRNAVAALRQMEQAGLMTDADRAMRRQIQDVLEATTQPDTGQQEQEGAG